ncbi:hypothetical protein FRX31_017539 [Thalictrum thalictroides]|uniref:Uncharacterized protein n=1 Tax=Thalictrum thalictroides TaxID=46969 RepID=A0A7J6W666_THATH|nr:hypothetical protein FRX31_017539 [Thalictrum thalictroides]
MKQQGGKLRLPNLRNNKKLPSQRAILFCLGSFWQSTWTDHIISNKRYPARKQGSVTNHKVRWGNSHLGP